MDADQDGYSEEVDCDDADADIHPDADEVCDGRDNNCDGVVDIDAIDQSEFHADLDGDGGAEGTGMGVGVLGINMWEFLYEHESDF